MVSLLGTPLSMTSTTDKERQLGSLSLLFEAINDTCRARDNVTYASGVADREENLSHTEVFLCKLSQVCDSRKGSDTITALACLKGADGPLYIIASNGRTDAELEATAFFLTGLLTYVIENPEALQPKAVRKQVLWRILEHNFGRLSLYLQALFEAVTQCTQDCLRRGEGHDSPSLQHLLALKERCMFPIDMGSTANMRDKFLHDCTDLINIIQDAKGKGLTRTLDARASIEAPENFIWSQLRHLLGRLHSYRQAADTIVAARARRPELFTDFQVSFVSKAPTRSSLVSRGTSLEQLLRAAFPDASTAAAAAEAPATADIKDMVAHGLRDGLYRLLNRHRSRTIVHCEVLLHDYLAQQGLATPAQFWDSAAFIATSKPPCMLCHFYFIALCSDFRVRAPHMNLYSKWRLPDMDADLVAGAGAGGVEGTQPYDEKSFFAEADREEILNDMIDQMQQATLRLLRDKTAVWRRHDSRTDTHAGFQSAASGVMPSGLHRGGAASARTDSAMSMAQLPPVAEYTLPVDAVASSTVTWSHVGQAV